MYSFVDANGQHRFDLPRSVAAELLLFLLLSPYLEVDLTRGWQEHIVASDASDMFGFGVAVAPCPGGLLRNIAREAYKRDTMIRLDRSERYDGDEPEKQRRGRPLRVPLSEAAFSTVVASKWRCRAHSGALETHAVTLSLRWLLRARCRHSRRTVLLIDAKSFLGAVAKGRSSAPSLRRELQTIAAYILAGDLLLRPLYIPSEDNPADAPSRGIVRRWRQRRQPTARKAIIDGVAHYPE